MSLPELVVFSAREANNGVRYLSFFGPHRLLRFRLEEGVYSDTVKFAVEPAGDGLVHIRSCYENYYWASFPLVQGPTVLFNGRIPKVDSTGELEFPEVATDVSTTWGNTKSVALIEKEYARLVLPPRSKVVATLSINMATYEVPFSYQQIDEFEIGGTKTQHLHDGVLKIESEYGVEFRYDIQPLTSEEIDDGNIETDLQVLEREGINAIDNGMEPNACIACG